MGVVVSVCLLSRHRSAELEACLMSLRAQEGAPPFEVVVGADRDHRVAPLVRQHFPDATVLDLPGTNVGASRNFLVEETSGEIVLFLDDDVVVPGGFLARLLALAEQYPGADVFGGPNVTPPGRPVFQVIQGEVLASAIGSGPVRRRYGARSARFADERSFTLCNLAFRRSVAGPFVAELVGGEENALLHDLAAAGVTMRYDPGLAVWHERRAGLRAFITQMTKYGRGRGQAARRRLRSLRPGYLAPTGFLLYLATLPLLVLASPWAIAPLGAYLAVVAAAACRVAARVRRPSTVPLAALLMLVVHASYGIGVVLGLARRSNGVHAVTPSGAAVASGR